MPKITIRNFQGAIPAVDATLLAPNQAQTAKNVDLSEGSIKPLYDIVDYITLTGIMNAKSVYKLSDGTDSFWIVGTSRASNFVQIPAQSADERYYMADGIQCKKSNLTLASNSGSSTFGTPDTEYYLPVPQISGTPSAALNAAGSGDYLETVSYVITWVTEWGEESEPSAASDTLDVDDDEWVKITGYDEPYELGGPYNIIGIRVYRTNTGTNANAEFQRITDLDDTGLTYKKIANAGLSDGTGTISVSGTAMTGSGTNFTGELSVDDYIYCKGHWFKVKTITDNTNIVLESPGAGDETLSGETFEYCTSWMTSVGYIADHDAATGTIYANDDLGSVIEVTDWTAPEDDIQGLIALSNNCVAAFKNNELYVSEAGYPFTMPSSYMCLTTHDIVALGGYETTIVAATKTSPYRFECYDPADIGKIRIPKSQSCVSGGRGMVSGPDFVMYPSPDGYVMINPDGLFISTKGVFTKEQWRTLLSSDQNVIETAYDKNLISFLYDDKIICFFENTNDGFILDLFGDQDSFYTPFELDTDVRVWGGYVDPELDALFLLVEIDRVWYLKIWGGGPTKAAYLLHIWDDLIHEWSDDEHEHYDTLSPIADTFQALTYTWKGKVDLFPVPVLMSVLRITGSISDTITAKIYADGTLLDTVSVTDESVYRFTGKTARKWEIQVEGTDTIKEIEVATCMDEMIYG